MKIKKWSCAILSCILLLSSLMCNIYANSDNIKIEYSTNGIDYTEIELNSFQENGIKVDDIDTTPNIYVRVKEAYMDGSVAAENVVCQLNVLNYDKYNYVHNYNVYGSGEFVIPTKLLTGHSYLAFFDSTKSLAKTDYGLALGIKTDKSDIELSESWFGDYIDDDGDSMILNKNGCLFKTRQGNLSGGYTVQSTIKQDGSIEKNNNKITVDLGYGNDCAYLDFNDFWNVFEYNENNKSFTVTSQFNRDEVIKYNNVYTYIGESQNIPIETIGLTTSKGQVLNKIGDTTKINVNVEPMNTTESKDVTFTSSNSDVASVNDLGEVVAKSKGITEIKAVSESGVEAMIVILVAQKIEIVDNFANNYKIPMSKNEEREISLMADGIKVDDKYITWSVINTDIAAISNGIIKGIKAGKTEVQAKLGVFQCRANIEVYESPIDFSTFEISATELKAGDQVNVSVSSRYDVKSSRITCWFNSADDKSSISVDLEKEGDSNRYSGTFQVQQFKQIGSWYIRYFYITSTKWYAVNNSNYYNYGIRDDFGTDIFNISGTVPDVTAPKIAYNDYSISKNKLTKDDMLTIKIKVTDDVIGVRGVKIFYNIGDKTKAFELEYNDESGYFEALIKSNDITPGDYKFYFINVVDYASNSTDYRNEFIEDGNTFDFSSLEFSYIDQEHPIPPVENCRVFTKNEFLINETIEGDIYVGPNAVVRLSGCTINGNVYVLGCLYLNSYKTDNLNINCAEVMWSGSSNIQGTVNISGHNVSTGNVSYTIRSSVSDGKLCYSVLDEVPVRFTEELSSYDGILSFKGATLDIADMYINNEKIKLENNRFVIDNLDVGDNDYLEIVFKTELNQTLKQKYKINRYKSIDEGYSKAPEIIADDITVIQGYDYDALVGVKALDREDGDLTSNIRIIENTVDNNKIGKYKIKYEVVDSSGMVTTYTRKVEVVAEEIVELKIKSQPKKLEYYQGDTYDETGLVIEAIYNSNKVENIPLDQLTRGEVDMENVGAKSVNYSIGDISISFDIIIKEVILISIEAKNTKSDKTHVGEYYAPMYMLTLIYNNGNSEEITRPEEATTNIIDTSTAGKKEIIVTYKGLTTSYYDEIYEPYPISMGVTNLRSYYSYGEELNEDIIFEFLMSDSKFKRIALDEVEVSYDKYLVGNQKVTIKYKDLDFYTTVYVSSPMIMTQTHVQDYGWLLSHGEEMAGTIGLSKRLEGIKISVDQIEKGVGGIQYQTHIQDIGWQGWKSDGALSGTTGQAKRLEAIRIKLTGTLSEKYDVYYRVHAENFGWLDWAKNGQSAGTAGYSCRLEAMQIKLVKKEDKAPGNTNKPYIQRYISYSTHVQDVGWQAKKYDGSMSGTSAQAKRLEGIKINLENQLFSGNIQYRTHIQDIGWENSWKSNGTMSGTSGQAKRLEAVQIKLTGEMANNYDVYYRVHAQDYGWLGWAKNGSNAGTEGLAKRLEAIEIVLVSKGGRAPGSANNCFIKK